MNTFSPYKRFVGSFLPNCLLQYTELNAIDKLVWARLAQFMGDSEYCYPKQKTLAFELGTTVLTVKRSLAKLEEKEFLKVKRSDDISKMSGTGNKYFFLEHEIFSNSSGIKMIPEGNEVSTLKRKGRTKFRSGIKMIPVESKRIKQENQKTKTSKNFIDLFPENFQQDEKFVSTWEQFLQFRKTDIKIAVSEVAAEKLKNKLVSDSSDNVSTAIEMINQSIERGYRGIFEVKQFNNSKQIKPGHKTTRDYGYSKLKKGDKIINTDTGEVTEI